MNFVSSMWNIGLRKFNLKAARPPKNQTNLITIALR
jgi:hypothetical protein